MLRGSWTLDLGDFADGKNDDTFPQIPVVLSQPRALLKSSRSNSRVWLNLLAGKFQYVYGTRAGEKQTYTKSQALWKNVHLDGGDSGFGGKFLVSRNRMLSLLSLYGLPKCL